MSMFSLRSSGPVVQTALVLSAVVACTTAIYQAFSLGRFTGFTMFGNQYFFLLLAALMPVVFLSIDWRGERRLADGRVGIIDIFLATTTFAVLLYFASTSDQALAEGWEYFAPSSVVGLSIVLWAATLEVVRRVGGWPIFIVVLIVSFFPVVAGYAPSTFAAVQTPIDLVAIFHVNSSEGIMGIPMRSFAQLVFGFLVFGVALQKTGGGEFFLNLAFAMLGHVRGGPAKVAILSSGFMGSMSGSVITNILTTGTLTIPAMKRIGLSARFAAGVETCASTGAVLMPPVMGATAFVMASFLEIPYSEIILAALIPSLLYYASLFLQIDLYAAREGLKGLPRADLPKIADVLKSGWQYILVLGLLIYMLLFLQRETVAPYYATALLLVLDQLRGSTRWGPSAFLDFLKGCGAIIAELAGLMAGVGLIMGGLAVTGMSGTIANDLLFLAGGEPLVLVLMGALTSFVLGIGMTVTAAYIFLAIALAPALQNVGFNPLAVHLFILYWGMLSYITPPVALGAFAAASVAKTKPMATAFTSMSLGMAIYVIPFLFVFNPALLLQDGLLPALRAVFFSMTGIAFLAIAIQGYVPWLGNFDGNRIISAFARAILAVGGLLIALPPNEYLTFGAFNPLLAGIVLTVIALIAAAVIRPHDQVVS